METMDCTSLREPLLEVLYGEAEPATARQVEEHLAGCAACREELTALKRLRLHLASWEIPRSLGPIARPPLRRWPRALAVAAGLLFGLATGLALRGAELRYEAGRVSLRLGANDSDLRQALAGLEARQQREMAALRTSLASPSQPDAALLAKVEDLIRDSEARQTVLLSASLTDQSERALAQRRLDLARMSAGLSYLEGRTGQQVARATELVGYVLQASQQQR
jgi:hypothetical protein